MGFIIRSSRFQKCVSYLSNVIYMHNQRETIWKAQNVLQEKRKMYSNRNKTNNSMYSNNNKTNNSIYSIVLQ
jgi:hypothetical protein